MKIRANDARMMPTISKRDAIREVREFLDGICGYSPRDGYHDDGKVTIDMKTVNDLHNKMRCIEAAELHGCVIRVREDGRLASMHV